MTKRLFDVRPEEYRNCIGGFITLFGIMAAHSLMEIARDALFLATLPATKLPAIYMGIAVLSLAAVVAIPIRFAAPMGKRWSDSSSAPVGSSIRSAASARSLMAVAVKRKRPVAMAVLRPPCVAMMDAWLRV